MKLSVVLMFLLLFAGSAVGQPPQAPRRPPQAPSLEERVLALETKISALQGIPQPFLAPSLFETWLVNGQFVQLPVGQPVLGSVFGGNCANGSCGPSSSFGGRRGLFGRR